jgi:hypothetical protein
MSRDCMFVCQDSKHAGLIEGLNEEDFDVYFVALIYIYILYIFNIES